VRAAADTPRSLTSLTASTLNSRLNLRFRMTTSGLIKHPNLVSIKPAAAHRDEFLARRHPAYAVAIFPNEIEPNEIAASVLRQEIDECAFGRGPDRQFSPTIWVGVIYESTHSERYHTIVQFMTPNIFLDGQPQLGWPIYHVSSHAI
jgi:hypothetical protein